MSLSFVLIILYMIIVATELHVRNFWHFFEFSFLAVLSQIQAKKTKGCIKAISSNKGWRIGYTITLWENKEAMMAFRNSGAHKKAMSKIRKLSPCYKTLRWESNIIPDWDMAKSKLATIDFIYLKEK